MWKGDSRSRWFLDQEDAYTVDNDNDSFVGVEVLLQGVN